MSLVPTKRLVVYLVVGVVVLVTGVVGVLLMRGGSEREGPERGGVLVATGLSVEGAAAGDASVGDGSDAASDVAGNSAGGGAGGQGVATTESPLIYVQVAGAVRRPGVYRLPLDSRVFQAIAEAGGFTQEADQDALTLAAKLGDGCRVYVPKVGETVPEAATLLGPSGDGSSGGLSPGGAAPGVVSINSATVEQLDSLPGIGPSIARDIIQYRETNGPFTSVEQLRDVPGIGPARMERLRPLVTL